MLSILAPIDFKHATGRSNVYKYDQYDQAVVDERVAQFRDQTSRFLAGELSEDEYKTLRLMNGLYVQRHAPMLRVAIPYGLLCSRQRSSRITLRRLAKKAMTPMTPMVCASGVPPSKMRIIVTPKI